MIEDELNDLKTQVRQQRDWMMMLLGAGALIGGAVSLFAKQIVAFVFR